MSTRLFRATVQDCDTLIKVLHNLSLVVQMKARRNQAGLWHQLQILIWHRDTMITALTFNSSREREKT